MFVGSWCVECRVIRFLFFSRAFFRQGDGSVFLDMGEDSVESRCS